MRACRSREPTILNSCSSSFFSSSPTMVFFDKSLALPTKETLSESTFRPEETQELRHPMLILFNPPFLHDGSSLISRPRMTQGSSGLCFPPPRWPSKVHVFDCGRSSGCSDS